MANIKAAKNCIIYFKVSIAWKSLSYLQNFDYQCSNYDILNIKVELTAQS